MSSANLKVLPHLIFAMNIMRDYFVFSNIGRKNELGWQNHKQALAVI